MAMTLLCDSFRNGSGPPSYGLRPAQIHMRHKDNGHAISVGPDGPFYPLNQFGAEDARTPDALSGNVL